MLTNWLCACERAPARYRVEYVRNSAWANGIAEIVQRALDSLVAPTHVLAGHAENQIDNFLVFRWPPRILTRSGIALGLDEFSMPTQDRASLSNRCDLSKLLSPESFALHCQETSLIVAEQNSFVAKLVSKYLILQLKVFDDLFLFLSYGLTEYSEDHLERLEKK